MENVYKEEPTMFIDIDHIQLAAPKNSEAAYRHFFHDVLGMPEIEKPDNLKKRGGVWFKCGQHEVHIGIQEPFTPATKAHPAFIVKDLALLKETLHAHNIDTIEDEPLENAIRFYVNDPCGNRLEFLERI